MNNPKSLFVFSGVTIFLIVFMLSFVSMSLNSQAGTLEVHASVSLESMYYKPPLLHPSFLLKIQGTPAGTPVTSAIITIDRRIRVPHMGGGEYYGNFEGYPDDPNKLITIAISSEHTVEPMLTAEGRITGRVTFLTPARGEILNLALVRSITIRWQSSGASGWRRSLWVDETTYPGGPSGATVYRNSDVTGDSVRIPAATFRPDQNYRIIIVISKDKIFRIRTGAVTLNSGIGGYYEVDTYFSTR